MKRFSFVLPLLIFSTQAFGVSDPNQMKKLAVAAEDSIVQFFISTSRRVESVKIETFSNLTGTNYLIQADVQAQSALSEEIIPYRCGVFLRKINRSWETQQTFCEALTAVTQ